MNAVPMIQRCLELQLNEGPLPPGVVTERRSDELVHGFSAWPQTEWCEHCQTNHGTLGATVPPHVE